MRALLIFALTACGGANDGVPGDDAQPDGPPGNDAPIGCTTGLTFAPQEPVVAVDTVVFVQSVVGGLDGVQTFTWNMRRNGATFTSFQLTDQDRVLTFSGAQPGTYEVFMRVTDPANTFCPEANVTIQVLPEGAGQSQVRLHAVAPGLPPLNTRVLVDGIPADSLADVVVGGEMAIGAITPASAAYLKFIPRSAPDAFVEVFSLSGDYGTVLRTEPHDVLIVPMSTDLAPQVVTWVPGMTLLPIDAGTTITGTVRDASGVLPNAKVQLFVAGVPSTLDTTNASGQFTIRAAVVPGAPVRFDVLPPRTTGLPRLVATSTTFDLGQPVTIQFAATQTRNLGGSVVRRGGAPVANAELVVAGNLANAGTVAGVNGTGLVRLAATANGAGALPTLLAPAASLTAVIEAAPGDWAQSALDLTAGVPASINAPAMTASATTVLPPVGATGLGGVTLDLVPRGVLADAGVPVMRVVSATNGGIATNLVAGGSYDLYFTDPGRRGAQRKLTNVSALPATLRLLTLTDVTVTITDGTNVLPNVLVQLRCPDCTGLERSRAIAEGITGADGRVTLAVERP